LGDVSTLSVQDLIDKLIVPLLPPSKTFYRIGILRPDEAFSNLSLEDIKEKFPGTPIDWVTLDDLSYGAAVVMHRERVTDFVHPYERTSTPIPTGIVLADGKLVTILPGFILYPVKKKAWFTTSRDNQTTVTIQVVLGVVAYGVIKLHGLIPRPKGQARIKVTLPTLSNGYKTVVTEELGSTTTRFCRLGYVLEHYGAIQEYALAENKQVGVMIGRDGIIGELPE
jgi:hypothetical protein